MNLVYARLGWRIGQDLNSRQVGEVNRVQPKTIFGSYSIHHSDR
jgi:hypothetical protein